ncbi:hypothetical protein BDM02DRAFT_3122257 [Thelephora ganbajun]|uniref:Uncharacterized protein n=1 Tax=Thelephora ganbajun TaxID=370292 RepID=A0ACB6Z3V6_THEGA|nr:hypothetical protein BDM02DRAFT_3122257 [Thelephora ganbajun]
MHNVTTKIMISGFRDIRRILEFPGAHGFSLTKEQIVAAKLPTTRSYYVPPQSASSLSEGVVAQAKDVKWPPQFFDTTEAGGSSGSFIRCFSSKLQTILVSTQTDLFYHTCLALRDFLAIIRDDVVNYRIFMMQLSNPHTGIPTLAREGIKGLRRRVNLRKDLGGAEAEWKSTITGRFLPDVEWRTAKVDKCETWITADGRIKAQIPEQWDRRKAASVNVYADC